MTEITSPLFDIETKRTVRLKEGTHVLRNSARLDILNTGHGVMGYGVQLRISSNGHPGGREGASFDSYAVDELIELLQIIKEGM